MLEEIKKYLNILDEQKDFLIENWLQEAKEFIKSEIGEFEKSEKNISKITENGKIFLSGINLEIVKVEKNIGTFFQPVLEEKTDFRFLNNILYLNNCGEYFITYNSGFEELPADLKQAIFLYINEKNNFENGKIKTEIVDMDRIDFELDNSIENKIFSLISKYKTYDFSA